jgi:hypothetical protein
MKQQQTADGRPRRRYVPRFAGEAFGHDGNPEEGPDLRRLVSTEAWKQPPSAKIRSEVAV